MWKKDNSIIPWDFCTPKPPLAAGARKCPLTFWWRFYFILSCIWGTSNKCKILKSFDNSPPSSWKLSKNLSILHFFISDLPVENNFQINFGSFWAWKFTLKTENALLLMALHQVVLQDINKSSQYVHLGVKMYWIPSATLWISTIVTTLVLVLPGRLQTYA